MALNLECDSLDGGNNKFSLCFQFISKCLVMDIPFMLKHFLKDVDVKEAFKTANISVFPDFERLNQNSLLEKKGRATFKLPDLLQCLPLFSVKYLS